MERDLMTAFLFGFTLAISVGPIAMIVVINGLKYGKASAIKSALGAALGDFVFALFAFLLGVGVVEVLTLHQRAIETFSSFMLILFGIYMCLLALREYKMPLTQPIATGASELRTTFLLTIVNPLTVIAFMALVGQLSLPGGVWTALLLAVMVLAGSFLAQLVYVFASLSLKSKLEHPRVILGLQLISGFGIVGFGLKGFFYR
jgi:threonine/homoserine/homoserine lactone efflux protein